MRNGILTHIICNQLSCTFVCSRTYVAVSVELTPSTDAVPPVEQCNLVHMKRGWMDRLARDLVF